MKKLQRRQILPSLVKNVDIISSHPGYRYNYFTSFDELDIYFKELCGEDWRTQEWAEFWFRDHWKSEKESIAKPETAKEIKEAKYKVHNENAVLAIYDQLRKEENLSIREIEILLRDTYNIKLTYRTIYRILHKHNIQIERRKGYKQQKRNKDRGEQ